MHALDRKSVSMTVSTAAAMRWLCVFIVSLCLTISAQAEDRAGPITIGATQTGILVWIAEERGLFAEQGLDVTVRLFSSGRHSSDALLKGDIELATASGSVFTSKAFIADNLRIAAALSASETARLIARGDRNIAKATDLKGKRIGVTAKTIGDFFLTRYLSLHRVALDEVTVVDLKPEDLARELVTGGLDAALSWEPYISDAERELQGNAVTLPGQVEQFFYFLLLTRDDWTRNHQPELKKILNALIASEAFVAEDPSEAKRIIQDKFGYMNSYVEKIWPLHSLHVNLPQGLLYNLELNANWQMQKGLTSARRLPRFLDFVLLKPLSDLRPSSVGVVK